MTYKALEIWKPFPISKVYCDNCFSFVICKLHLSQIWLGLYVFLYFLYTDNILIFVAKSEIFKINLPVLVKGFTVQFVFDFILFVEVKVPTWLESLYWMNIGEAICSINLTLFQIMNWWISYIHHAFRIKLSFTSETIESRLTRANLIFHFFFFQLKLIVIVFFKYIGLLFTYSYPPFFRLVKVLRLGLLTFLSVVVAFIGWFQVNFF